MPATEPGPQIVASASEDPDGMAEQAPAPAIGVMHRMAPPQPVLDTKPNGATSKGWDAARRAM